MPNYDPLFYWVREREAILQRQRRNADARDDYQQKCALWEKEQSTPSGIPIDPPARPVLETLTQNPILAEWRFCNVRREDDRVTIWIKDNIRTPYADHPLLWLMLCIARQINWPGTLGQLMSEDGPYPTAWPRGDGWHAADLRDAMEDIKSMGLKLYTGAYMISAPAEKGTLKQQYIAFDVIGELYEDRQAFIEWFTYPHRNLAKTHERLSRYLGWGDFMSYQAIVDMRFTKLLDHAPDLESWCAAGPGTLRGLNRLHNRKLTFKPSQEQARMEIKAIWKVIRQETGVEMDFSDVPNCLCETDKYLRVQNGEGTPRARYVPFFEQPLPHEGVPF